MFFVLGSFGRLFGHGGNIYGVAHLHAAMDGTYFDDEESNSSSDDSDHDQHGDNEGDDDGDDEASDKKPSAQERTKVVKDNGDDEAGDSGDSDEGSYSDDETVHGECVARMERNNDAHPDDPMFNDIGQDIYGNDVLGRFSSDEEGGSADSICPEDEGGLPSVVVQRYIAVYKKIYKKKVPHKIGMTGGSPQRIKNTFLSGLAALLSYQFVHNKTVTPSKNLLELPSEEMNACKKIVLKTLGVKNPKIISWALTKNMKSWMDHQKKLAKVGYYKKKGGNVNGIYVYYWQALRDVGYNILCPMAEAELRRRQNENSDK